MRFGIPDHGRRWVAVAVCLAASLPSQRFVEPFEFPDLTDRFVIPKTKDRQGLEVPQAFHARARLHRMLRAHEAAPPVQRGPSGPLGQGAAQSIVILSGSDRFQTFAKKLLARLKEPKQPKLEVQCTLIRMPEAVADELGLGVGDRLPVDVAFAGKVTKAALAAKGSLRNFPLVTASPMIPFRSLGAGASRKDLPHTGAKPKTRTKSQPKHQPKPLHLWGEAAMLGAHEAFVSVQLATQLPDDPSAAPKVPLMISGMELRKGAGRMVRAHTVEGWPESQAALILWVRLVNVVPVDDRSQPQPDKKAGK